MTSRERVIAALKHEKTDRVPIDLGGTSSSGIHAIALDKLRKALSLKKSIVKVIDPTAMCGLVESDLLKKIGGDVVGLYPTDTLLGYKNEDWQEWKLPDGTKVLMGGGFKYTYDQDGAIYAYPKGNTKVAPSVKMPSKGVYFDNIIRQEDLSNHEFSAKKDYKDQFYIYSEEDCLYFERMSKTLYQGTDYAIFGNFFLGNIGDVFRLPGAWIEEPKGIRDIQEWLIAHYDHPSYIKELFDMQKENVLKNLSLYKQAVGDRIVAIGICATDFGTQIGPIFSIDIYREFYKPYHKIFNDWVHKNTNWKVFYHSCGSILDFMEDFIEVGVDIINPVQVSAAGMELESLKSKFGDRIVFWGGGIDPQKTLPFGTKEEVEQETIENVKILSKGGGFICSAVHNIQAFTPVENIISFFRSINN